MLASPNWIQLRCDHFYGVFAAKASQKEEMKKKMMKIPTIVNALW